MGKNNQQKPIKQYQKFGIRKFTQGVASVMIASGMFFMAGGVASANEVAVQTETTTQKVAEETAPKKTEEKQESKQEERTVQLDKTQLENYIKEITSNIEAGKYASKTEESVASLKAELSSAQATLTSAKTQEELTKAYQKLVTTVNSKLKNKSVEKKETPATEDTTNGKPTVGKSAANTEPVSESNSIANTGKNDERNGKEINKENAFRADVADTVTEPPLSEEEQANHWKQYADKNTERLTKQIKWFDIANSKATVENIGDGDRLKVGTKFTQEISPGYVVTLTVTKLAPFNSTDEYKKRGGAGYDANAQNVYKDNTPAELKVVTQGGYSVAKTNGMDTQGKTVIQSVVDGANVGVEFSVKSTLNGKEVPSNVVFLTGEEAGSSEIEIYKTDGDGFELVTELSNTTPQYSTARSYIGEIYERRTVDTAGHGQNRTDGQLGISYTLEGNGKPAFAPFLADKGAGFFNTTVTSDTVITATAKDGTIHADGLGTQVFGPVSTHRESGFSTPLVMTRNAKNIGMYILSAGQQGSMLGFMVLDEGDAPASYGRVAHSISKSDGQKQPYLGSVPADVDVRTTPINKTTAFVYDDINGIGAADEGARQLMGDDVAPNDNYKLKKVNDGTYSMTFDAHLDGEAKAYVNGWIDFNNNGKFDEGEAAGVTEVTQDGKVTLTWTNNYQNVDTTATKLATRLRIAYDKADVKAPTGIAYSGEVEDFQIQQTIPPRGTKKETKDVQGATQTSTVAFNAYGQKNYDFDKDNAIDTTVKSQIVKPDGSLVRDADLVDGYYVVPGQGKYKITDNGVNVDVEFIPEANFVGTADGITIRRTDVNGNTTGWGNEGRTIIGGEGENKDQLELVSEQVQLTGLAAKGSMDGRYIPTVTPKEIKGTPEESTDIQGKPQTKTPKFSINVDKDGDGTAPDAVTPSAQYPAKLVDPATGQPTDEKTVTVKGEGTYTIDPETGAVTFTPEPQFTGTAKGIDVSLTAPVGQDKNGQPATATATTKYTPTVTPVKPTATPDTSTGVQGETQTGKPTFTEGNTEVPIKEGSVKLLNPDGTEANGPVDALDPTGKKIGEYTVEPTTGVVTFTPTDKSYTGPVQPAKVQAEDKNGSKVDTTYTPSIVGVTPTAEPATTQDIQGKTQESAVSFEGGKTTIAGKEKAVEIDPATYTLLGEDGQPVTEVPAKDPEGNVIGKYTLKTVDGKAVAVFEPTDKTYSGDVQPVRVQAKDKNGTAVETTYTPKITPVTPTAEPAQSAAIQGETQKGTPTFSPGDTIAPIKENSYKLLDKEGNEVPTGQTTPAYAEDGVTPVGTYSINPATGEVTFTPTDKSYTGKVLPAKVQGEDTNGTKVSTTYTPSIVPATPTAEPAKTVDVQGATQTGKPVFQGGTAMVNGEEKTVEIDEDKPAKLVDPKTGEQVDSVTVEGEGTYTVAPDGTVTFTPEKTFTGVAKGVEVVRKDKNGTPVKASYTPEVKPATPTGTDAITEDIQGATQTGKPTFEGGKVTVNGEEKTVEINEDKPAKLVDPKTGDPVDSVTIEGEGTYTVAPDGTVTFKPEKNFTGKGTGVTVQREDKNGTPVKAKYTPVVKPTTPTSTDVITTNVQGATQEGTPTFEGGKVTVNGEEKTVEIDETVKPTFDDGTTTKEVPGEGTYTIDENGVVTFTPEPQFTGKASGVTVKRVDKNGTEITAQYTPTVKPVTPKAKGVTTTDVQGAKQTGTPVFTAGKTTVNGVEKTVDLDDTKPATFEDGSTTKEVPGEGTYTVAPDGTVTFTPNKDFTGQATGVTVKRVDKNGTPVTATYTPVVLPVTPAGKDVTSIGEKGKPQSETPVFTPGTTKVNGKTVTVPIDEKVAPTFDDGTTEKKVPGEGTYTIDKNGKVTFTPEKDFVGKAKGVTVKRVDENGTPVTAQYTPTVLAKTTTENVVSEGAKGQPQSNTPVFKGDVDTTVAPTFKDGSTTKEVPGQGTYTIDATGKVTFTPEKDFVGKATPVEVVRKDKNGKTIKASYTPTVRPDTKFVVVGKDGKETEIIPSKDGKNPSEKISGYKLVKTETDDKGNTKHIYEPVTTKHVDKNGNPIPGTTTEEGTTPAKTSKELPGYKVVETRKLPNGDTEYVYEKVTTSFVDTDGHVIEGTTTEEGTTPKKDIPGYKFVETKTLENGDTEHVYERVTTTFKDKDGNLITVDKDNNPVESTEEGEKPAKSIPGYKFVETKKLPNGDVEHVYKKVTTPAPTPSVEKPKGLIRDTEGNVIPGFEFDMLSPVLDIPEYEYVETVTEKDGTVKHIYRKVKKSHLQPNVQPTNNRATIWTDENGNPLKSSESGAKEPGTIPGYEYVKTVTDPAGTIKHIFRKVEMPTPVDPTQPVQPVEPATPAMPEQPAKPQVPATPAQPVQDAQTTVSKDTETKRELPNTGTEDHASLAALGLLGVLSGFGLVARKKKED